ncbi:MAG: glutamate racemase [Chlamydiia bacterium]|nr:glutamate racemase [Chlamydiia bacterium]
MTPDAPIGLFDSGVGGLTIMRSLMRQLPQEKLIYLGDTARVPYGNKSPQAIIRYTLDCVNFLIKQRIKLLVVACFTASSHVLYLLQETLPIPVIGVIQCGIEELTRTTRSGRVAILGTTSTIHSGIIQSLLQQRSPLITAFSIACPLFVPFIEEGLIEHPALMLMARHYLASLKTENIDSALLACTHYPMIRSIIQEVLGKDIALVEPAMSCARSAQHTLAQKGWLNQQNQKQDCLFYTTDDTEKFRASAHQFLGFPIETVRPIDL